MDVGLSTGALVAAAGTTAAVGGIGLAVVFRLSRSSPTWAARLAPVTAVVAVAAGVTAASMAMLLDAEQVLLMVLVLAVSTSIAVIFGVIGGRRVADLQRRAADHEAALQRDREIEERRRELISWLSHDLRTPLARMRALTEAHEDGLAPVDYSTRMMREVDGLTVIVEDIATLSRLRSPTTKLDRQTTDLSDLVSDTVSSSQPVADQLGIQLEAVGQGGINVTADPSELSRAVSNLIANALRHTRPEGFVRVGVSQPGGEACIEVADQCGGIPDDQIGRLFDPGWRGTTARTPGAGGAGLGLTITRSVVEAHGGSVAVANSADGCVFTIRLPLGDTAPHRDADEVPASTTPQDLDESTSSTPQGRG